MLHLTGHGRLTRDPELRTTPTGKTVTTVSVACDRLDRSADPVYVDLVLWERQAEAAVEHLRKGQSVAFVGRYEPRIWTGDDGRERLAHEAVRVDLEYGARTRPATDRQAAPLDPAD